MGRQGSKATCVLCSALGGVVVVVREGREGEEGREELSASRVEEEGWCGRGGSKVRGGYIEMSMGAEECRSGVRGMNEG